MPTQVAITTGMRIATQMKPALCRKVSVPAGIRPIRVPEVFCNTSEVPPNMPTVITSGIRICIVVTPKLPSPAFMPRE